MFCDIKMKLNTKVIERVARYIQTIVLHSMTAVEMIHSVWQAWCIQMMKNLAYKFDDIIKY
jgi:hypothetical protein